jgi:hypothetical protein
MCKAHANGGIDPTDSVRSLEAKKKLWREIAFPKALLLT